MTGNQIISSFKPALSAELLLKHDYFTLYPNDGGGGFVMREEFPSLEDALITEHIFQHDGLKDFGSPAAIDYFKHAAWKTIERSCWINRLYWIVPPARIACLNLDRTLARKIVEAVLYFKNTQPAPATAAEAREIESEITRRRDTEYNQGLFNNPAPVPYQWYDFQPAARIIHIINSLWFLKDLQVWSDDEADELVQLVNTHAQVIFYQEEALGLQPGNHQALRSLALIYAGCFLDNKDYLECGFRLLEAHARQDFASDGMLKEYSPQYHAFESWIIRDACYLAKQYNFALQEYTWQMLQKAAAACRLTTRPDGRAVSINDGCNLNTNIFLQTMPELEKSSEFALLPESQLAIRQNNLWYVLLDASNFTGKFSHYHAGKNAITLFYKNQPFVLDSGCCHYDWPEFKGYFKRGEAHASLLVDGMGDGYAEGTYHWLFYANCRISRWLNGAIDSTLTSDVPTWQGVTWKRSLQCSGDAVVLTDCITADREHFYEFIYPLHPDVKVEISDNSVTLSSGTAQLQIELQSDSLLTVGTAPACWCDDVKIIPTRRLTIRLQGRNVQLTTCFKGA